MDARVNILEIEQIESVDVFVEGELMGSADCTIANGFGKFYGDGGEYLLNNGEYIAVNGYGVTTK